MIKAHGCTSDWIRKNIIYGKRTNKNAIEKRIDLYEWLEHIFHENISYFPVHFDWKE